MSKMTVPVVSDFIVPFLNDMNEFADFAIPHSFVEGEFDTGFHPELGFSIGASDMNMDSRLFP